MLLGVHSMKFLPLILLVAFAPTEEPHHLRQLSEPEIRQTYVQMLRDACRQADAEWKLAKFNSTPSQSPVAGYWGDGVSIGNAGIRTAASMVLGCATLLKYYPALSNADRRELLAKATAALRYIAATHVTGTQKCTDGKPWGAADKLSAASWQSGMWTGTMACGAWLIWDKLNPELQQDLERVIAWEDDNLSNRPPRHNLALDTKAEENGWEVPALVLGELMFPTNPRATAWHESALDYMMNTLSTDADTHDDSILDGRPVNQWVRGANLGPDFTLENHNIFHPSYVGCSSYFLTQASLYYAYARRTIPAAANHHLIDTWHTFETIMLPWGEAAYPQGMDWELHGLPFLNLFATLATRDHDRFAARMEQTSLQTIRAWQRSNAGSLAPPGSSLGIIRHAINVEQASYGLLAHEVFGPAAQQLTATDANEHVAGVHEFPFVQIIAHRTQQKFVSFSWKNRIMGLVIPIGEGHNDTPNFTVPITNGLVGSFDLMPRAEQPPTVVRHSWKKTPAGFETTGTILLNGGKLKQTLRLTSIGDQVVVYEDRVTAMADVTVDRERGVPLGIENDPLTGGLRTLTGNDHQAILDWHKPAAPITLAGNWANVDGRLAVVMLEGTGLNYTQASKYSPGISVGGDILYGSYSNHRRQFKPGDKVAHRLAVVLTETSPEQTAAIANSCRVKKSGDSPILNFELSDGKRVSLSLAGFCM